MVPPCSDKSAFPEAVENVATVMGNLLKVQSRMETARDKLYALEESQESKQNPSYIFIIIVLEIDVTL